MTALRKAEGTWGSGIVEQVSLDLQNEFPDVKGFSARNLWNMKKWYSFYALDQETPEFLARLDHQKLLSDRKLHQLGAEMIEEDFGESLYQKGIVYFW